MPNFSNILSSGFAAVSDLISGKKRDITPELIIEISSTVAYGETEEDRESALQVLSDLVTSRRVDIDSRRMATTNLGSIAERINKEMLSDFHDVMDTDILEEERAQILSSSDHAKAIKVAEGKVLDIFSTLDQGVFPQAVRSIGPIVMETKSPIVTFTGLKILLQSLDDKVIDPYAQDALGVSANFLDKILDDKQHYDTQKIIAIAQAFKDAKNLPPKLMEIVEDYKDFATVQELRKLERCIKKIKGLVEIESARVRVRGKDQISEKGQKMRDRMAHVIKTIRGAEVAIQDLASLSKIFESSETPQEIETVSEDPIVSLSPVDTEVGDELKQ